MLCPSCSHDNPAEARFCMSCAEALKRVCSACGTEAPPEARFCMSCAAPLEAPPPPTRTPTPAPSPALPASFAGGCYQVKRFLGEAARIAGRVQGGQILVSEVVRTVVASLAGVEFRDAGRKQLKSIKGRQRLYEVVW